MNELSDVDGIKRWQIMGFSEKESMRLYELGKEYSEKISCLFIDDSTLPLIVVMPDMFISRRDADAFLNSISQNKDVNPTIPKLKKRIKYCRNPMEKKKLQQELNQAYKEQKRVGNGKGQNTVQHMW